MKSKIGSKWFYFVLFFLLCVAIEIAGGLFTSASVHSWYPYLKKASWNPPPWVFGPVWTFLYLTIAISGWLVFLSPRSEKRSLALKIYGLQLVFNFLWSYFFFYLQSPALGFIDILFLIVSVYFTIRAFWPLSRAAALLLVPYFVWTTYAVTLNAAIWVMNK